MVMEKKLKKEKEELLLLLLLQLLLLATEAHQALTISQGLGWVFHIYFLI